MKRLICLVLALCLICTAALAADYTLPEKLTKQIEFGNGIKGSISFEVSGDAEWIQPLVNLTGVDFQLRAISDTNGWQCRLYALDGEAERGSTWVWGDANRVFLSSELLPDRLLCLTHNGDLSTLAGAQAGNPSWLPALTAFLQLSSLEWDSEWTPALKGLQQTLDMWLSSYVTATSETVNGTRVTVIRYELTPAQLREGLTTVLETAFNDSTLMNLLRELIPEELMDVYLNPEYIDFYGQVVDQLGLSENLVMERRVTTQGQDLSCVVTLPLSAAMGGPGTLELRQENGGTTLSLMSEARQASFSWKESTDGGWYGSLMLQEGEQIFAADYSLSREHSESTDDEDKGHDITQWQLLLTPGEGDTLLKDSVTTSLTLHYSGKSAQRNPTTLNAELVLETADAHLKGVLEIRTASPWVIEDLPDTDAEAVEAMSQEELNQVGSALGEEFTRLCNDLTTVGKEVAEATEAPEPTESAEPTETPEPTESATQEAADEAVTAQ